MALEHEQQAGTVESPSLDRVPSRSKDVPSKSLYLSHFLSTWNTRGFEFGAVLFLATIFPGTLLPMSIYALVRAAAAILLAHHVGRYIDGQERLQVVRVSIVGQRLAVILSCIGLLFLLTGPSDKTSLEGQLVFAGLVVLACIEKLCSIMNTVAVERDWVVVIASNNEDILQELNSQMRRIDLFCKLVAPLVVALIDGRSTRIALYITVAVNVISVGIEYLFIAKVFRRTPALARQGSQQDPIDIDDSESPLQRTASRTERLRARQNSILMAAKTYVSSAAFLPSLALSMLYLTVLSFGGQMTTFLLAVPEPNMTSTTVGLLRTVSTVFELSATFIAPKLMNRIGPVRAGIWCLSWQMLCLTVGVGMLWLPVIGTSAQAIIIFVATVILSRAGLWCFDLVAQLLIQNSIDSSLRGSFSSTEAALQNFFELCTFATTIGFSKPEQFGYPALISLVATFCAAALYAKYVRDRRGHLLHMPVCLKYVGGDRYEMIESPSLDDPETFNAR